MSRNPEKRRNRFLNAICSDSGECMALGRETKTIRKYFNGFTNFEFLESPIRSIGSVSANGFVKKLKYTRDGYTAHAILKSSQKPRADNLAYEFSVGQYVNKLCYRFPCFLETYGLYYYNDDASWLNIRDNKSIRDTRLLISALTKPINSGYDIDYSNACANSKYASILLQDIDAPQTLNSIMSPLVTYSKKWWGVQTNYDNYHAFIEHELPLILFQIYFALSALSTTFTHYDLHIENVLLYTLDSNKYLHYHYHYADGSVVSFKSKYIAKLIDYGRCYFKDDDANMDSLKIKHLLCDADLAPACNIPNGAPCGYNAGFGWLKNRSLRSSHYIDSATPNHSHDLRLIRDIREACMYNINSNANLYKLFKNLTYETEYGTVALDSNTKTARRNTLDIKINNVSDASRYFKNLINNNNNNIIEHNEINYGIFESSGSYDNIQIAYTKVGDLHIYEENTPMKYIPNN